MGIWSWSLSVHTNQSLHFGQETEVVVHSIVEKWRSIGNNRDSGISFEYGGAKFIDNTLALHRVLGNKVKKVGCEEGLNKNGVKNLPYHRRCP